MNINRVCFTGNLTAEPEVNYSPKGTAVVSASIVNNELYGCADYGVGRISLRNRASLQVSIMGIMPRSLRPRSLLARRPIRREQLPLRPPVDRRAFVNKCLSASWR